MTIITPSTGLGFAHKAAGTKSLLSPSLHLSGGRLASVARRGQAEARGQSAGGAGRAHAGGHVTTRLVREASDQEAGSET